MELRHPAIQLPECRDTQVHELDGRSRSGMAIARLIGIVEQSGDRVEILHSIRSLLRYPYIHRILLPNVTHVSSPNEPYLILRDIFSLQNIISLLLKLSVNDIQFLISGFIHSFIKLLRTFLPYLRLTHTPARKHTRTP